MKRVACALAVGLVVALGVAIAWTQEAAEVVDERVEAGVDGAADVRIAERLLASFERLDGLRGVDVTVRAGVVELSATVPSATARTLAGELARQVVGVSAVENGIEIDRTVARRLGVALDTLEERLRDLVGALPLLAVALVVFVAFLGWGGPPRAGSGPTGAPVRMRSCATWFVRSSGTRSL